MLTKRSDLARIAQTLGGLPVYGCPVGSSAERAGVRWGDVLLSVDGRPTPTWTSYVDARQASGETLRLRLFRNGEEFEVDLVLDPDPLQDPMIMPALFGGDPEVIADQPETN
jgi:S1-C subfamily serine protease